MSWSYGFRPLESIRGTSCPSLGRNKGCGAEIALVDCHALSRRADGVGRRRYAVAATENTPSSQAREAGELNMLNKGAGISRTRFMTFTRTTDGR